MDTAALQGKSRRRQRRKAVHLRVARFGGFDEIQTICYLWDIVKVLEAGTDSGDGELVKLNKEVGRRVRVEIRRYLVRRKRRNVKLVAAVLMLVLAMIETFGSLIGTDWVSGNSMYPYLNHGGWAVYSRRLGNKIHRDEVVIFEKNGENLIRRAAGLPGDLVKISEAGDRAAVNGEEGNGNHVTLAGSAKGGSGNPMSQPMTMMDGQYLVPGDNRGISIDSRDENIGTVPRENILGEAFLIVRTRG